jgi:methyl-accepting chemotaxis protein
VVYIQATYTPVLDQAGKTTAVVKFAVDVTAAVEAKHADQKLQQLYLQMVENTSVRLIVANREGTITYMNPASLEALRSGPSTSETSWPTRKTCHTGPRFRWAMNGSI